MMATNIPFLPSPLPQKHVEPNNAGWLNWNNQSQPAPDQVVLQNNTEDNNPEDDSS
jgi:hypothetical protein